MKAKLINIVSSLWGLKGSFAQGGVEDGAQKGSIIFQDVPLRGNWPGRTKGHLALNVR